MLSDYKNNLYFVFATPIVQEFERVNSLFQSTQQYPHVLQKELFMLKTSLKNRMYDANGHQKMLHNVDFGIKFLTKCSKYTERTGKFDDVQNIKERCLFMLEEAVTQVNDRLPSQHDIFKDLSKLHLSCVQNQTTKPAFYQLPFLYLAESNMNTIEEQYRKIVFVDWAQDPAFFNGIPNESKNFWVGVLQHASFTELAAYAFDCLNTPISSAAVERVFSMVSSIKTKPRN